MECKGNRVEEIRIAIDAHMVGQWETGNERYTLNLINGLTRVDTENRYSLLVTNPDFLRQTLVLPPNFEIRVVRPKANVPRVAWAMPRACQHAGAQVLHVSYTAPPVCPCPTVVTVHDISYKIFPHFFSPRDRLLLSITVPLSCRSAARVIAVSEWTKNDLIRQYGIPEGKIRVVYEAAEERFSPDVPYEEVRRVRRQYAGERRYILSVGNIQPRKNLVRLVRAFATIAHEGVGEEPLLLIAGQSRWGGSEVLNEVKIRGLEKRVRFLGYVPDKDLPALYRGAEIFVYPSLYEGFGLPPLEAMACGTPVVCSNAAALPEIVGDAALLFDPQDTKALTEALRRLLEDEQERKALSGAGLARAARFSWEQTARETLQVYQEATGG